MKPLLGGLMTALLCQAALVIVQPQVVLALTAAEVNRIAKQITVLIEGPGADGSGIVIGRLGNTYRVLTAAHVIENLYPEEEAYIITPDRQRHTINTQTIERLRKVDLAIVEFESDRNYPIATLGNSASLGEGEAIYVAGFPLPTTEIARSVYNFVPGQISAKPSQSMRDGYKLIYTNDTLPGMSGGPVLNDRGEVIGVHGRADTTDIQAAYNPDVYVRTGFSLGIPIDTYRKAIANNAEVNENRRVSVTNRSQRENLDRQRKTEIVNSRPNINDTLPRRNGTLNAWQTHTNETSPQRSPNASSLPINPNERLVAYYSPKDFSLAASLEENSDRNIGAVHAVAIAPDGRTLVTGNNDKSIDIWNLDRGNLAHHLIGHQDLVTSVAITPDGQTLISGSKDKTIKIWNLATGKLRTTLTSHSNAVTSVAISPDGRILVSGSADKTIKIWNLNSGNLMRTLTGHKALVRTVAIAPDGRTLVSGSYDTTIKIWDLVSGQLQRTLTGHAGWVNALAISPDSTTVASGSDDKTIKIWNLANGQLQRTLESHKMWVNAVAIAPDGKTLISGSADNTIKMWDLASGELQKTLEGHENRVNTLAISPDGQILISGGSGNTLKVWKGNR